jgi:hypothetical protein
MIPPAKELAKSKFAKEKDNEDRKKVPDEQSEQPVNVWLKQDKECCPCEKRPDLPDQVRHSAEEQVLFEDKLMSHVFPGRRPATGNIECHADMDKCVNTCRVDA